MDFADFKNIDLRNFGASPAPIKLAAIALACIGILLAGYFLIIEGQVKEHEELQKKESELRETYLSKKALAINLPVYKQQMAEMEQTFAIMRRQLPSSTEIPDLLIDITQAGLGNGLEFVLFKPEKEKPIDFYAELPISIKVNGSYHELGQFLSALAALPRIVTVSDVSISGGQKEKNSLSLSIVLTAKTYRYLEEGGAAPARKPAKGKG